MSSSSCSRHEIARCLLLVSHRATSHLVIQAAYTYGGRVVINAAFRDDRCQRRQCQHSCRRSWCWRKYGSGFLALAQDVI